MARSKRSYIAFKLSMEAIKQQSMYLWTLTTAEAMDVKMVQSMWSRKFLHHITNGFDNGFIESFPGVSGLRVYEMHPGGHGLHIHFVIDRRVSVDIVRVIASRAGFGRIHVKEIPGEHALYLGKYLRKQERPECLKGQRLWACFGAAEGTSVKDIIVDNEFSQAYRFLATWVQGWDRLKFPERMAMTVAWMGGMSIEDAFSSIGWSAGGKDFHHMMAHAESVMTAADEKENKRKRIYNGVPKWQQDDAARKAREIVLVKAGIMVRDAKAEGGIRFKLPNEPF